MGLGLGAIYQHESTPKGGAWKGTVPSFARVDAAAYYQLSENLRLQVNVENLLDEDYYPHAYMITNSLWVRLQTRLYRSKVLSRSNYFLYM